MAVILYHFLHSPLPPPPPFPFRSPPSSRIPIAVSSSSPSASSHMEPPACGRTKFMEFPYVSAPHRKLMVDLVSGAENRLDPHLLPCTLPPDVQYYENQNGSAQASLHIRCGNKSSNIDLILGSWIHCQLPMGGALNITSLSAYLNQSTDAPNFLIELIQSSPTSLVLILDLPPRKDLILHSDYLHTFYEDTQLDRHRQMLEKIPEVRPYFSSSLYIRCVVSPTAIMFHIETEAGGPGRLEDIVENHVTPIAKEMLGVWLDQCACADREVGETERAYLVKRDEIIKRKTIEVDLGSNFPRLFGPEIAGRVLVAIREVFGV